MPYNDAKKTRAQKSAKSFRSEYCEMFREGNGAFCVFPQLFARVKKKQRDLIAVSL